MKRLSFFSILLFLSVIVTAQIHGSTDTALFALGFEFEKLASSHLGLDDQIHSKDTATDVGKAKAEYAEDIKEAILERSLKFYDQLIDSFPASKLIFRALANKALIEYDLEEFDESRKCYLQLLNSKADDKEVGGRGTGIMAEPYANYKNTACNMLADIEMRDSNYAQALKYLDLMSTYPYQHFCGNEIASERICTAIKYARCYNGLADYQKSYDVLIPEIISNGLASNHELVELAIKTLRLSYSNDELIKKYQKAIRNIHKETQIVESNSYTVLYIFFLNRRINLEGTYVDDPFQKENTKVIRQQLEREEFYKLLKNQAL